MVNNLPANAGDVRDEGLISEPGRSLEEGPTPVFWPGASLGWGACQAIVPRVTKSQTRLKQLSMHTGCPPQCYFEANAFIFQICMISGINISVCM